MVLWAALCVVERFVGKVDAGREYTRNGGGLGTVTATN